MMSAYMNVPEEDCLLANTYTESKKRANEKYHKAHLEQLAIRVPKGKRDEYKAKAEAHGKSLARYIMDLIENDP